MHFEGAAVPAILAARDLPLDTVLFPHRSGFVAPLLRQMQEEATHHDPRWEDLVELHFRELCLRLAREGLLSAESCLSPRMAELPERLRVLRGTLWVAQKYHRGRCPRASSTVPNANRSWRTLLICIAPYGRRASSAQPGWPASFCTSAGRAQSAGRRGVWEQAPKCYLRGTEWSLLSSARKMPSRSTYMAAIRPPVRRCRPCGPEAGIAAAAGMQDGSAALFGAAVVRQAPSKPVNGSRVALGLRTTQDPSYLPRREAQQPCRFDLAPPALRQRGHRLQPISIPPTHLGPVSIPVHPRSFPPSGNPTFPPGRKRTLLVGCDRRRARSCGEAGLRIRWSRPR